MAYAFSDTLQHVYLASPIRSRKVEDVLASPAVSLLWDNRTGNLADHGEGMLVTASGRAAVLEMDGPSSSDAEGEALLLDRNPNQAAFMARDDVAVMRVSVDAYAVVVGYSRPKLVRMSEAN